MNSQNNIKPTPQLTTQNLAKSLDLNENLLIKTALDMGFDPDNLTEGEGVAIANYLNGTTPTAIKGQPSEPAKSDEIDSLSLVAESEELDLAADNVAQNVSNGSSIKQGFIESEVSKADAQGEMLGALTTAVFVDSFQKTVAGNLEIFKGISDKNHSEFMDSIVAKFSELGKGNPSDLPKNMNEMEQKQQAKTKAYTDKICSNFNPKFWQN